MWVRSSTGGTRPADRPASAGRWGREASTDHSHEDGERAVDAVLLTPQDPRTTRRRRVPTAHGPATAPKLRNTSDPSCFAVLRVLPGPQVGATRRGWRGP